MAQAGPKFPTAATGNTNSVGSGTIAWSNPTNIEANDGAFALATNTVNNSAQVSDDLVGTGFGFSIPGSATIRGILLEVNYKGVVTNSGLDAIVENNVRLLKAGVAAGSDKTTHAGLPSTATTVSYGGSSDLWGTTWTPADINNSGFGAATVYGWTAGDTTDVVFAEVDFFRITVFYTTATSMLIFF